MFLLGMFIIHKLVSVYITKSSGEGHRGESINYGLLPHLTGNHYCTSADPLYHFFSMYIPPIHFFRYPGVRSSRYPGVRNSRYPGVRRSSMAQAGKQAGNDKLAEGDYVKVWCGA